jgi:hypothetical protein
MVGFPTETVEDLCSTVNFSGELSADTIGVHIAQILPGSDLFTLALEEGKIAPDVFDKYAKGELKTSLPVYIPEGLSLKDLKDARKKAYNKFYFRPKFILRTLSQDLRSFRKLRNDVNTALKLRSEGKTAAEPE